MIYVKNAFGLEFGVVKVYEMLKVSIYVIFW